MIMKRKNPPNSNPASEYAVTGVRPAFMTITRAENAGAPVNRQ
jgi:hypothetical protein